jgi:hypothetical protein
LLRLLFDLLVASAPQVLSNDRRSRSTCQATAFTVHCLVDLAKRKMTITTKTTAPKTDKSNRNSPASDHSGCSGNDNMTRSDDILQEKRQLAGCPPDVALPARHYAQPTATADTRVATGKDQQQQNKTVKNRRHVDNVDNDDDRHYQTLTTTTTATTTKPGAVFIPGIHARTSLYTDDSDSSDMDSSDDDSVLDIPELHAMHMGQSSHGDDGDAAAAAGESVAVAVEVDEEQVPRIKAVPMAANVTAKKKVPFHKAKTFCKIALILLISIIIFGVAIITIIVRAGYRDSDGDGVDRENLGIREAIQALVGAEQLESPESPYSKALEWMIHKDPMQLVPGVHSNFVQRFIMAYFYYATTANGPWRSCNPRLGNELEFCYRLVANTVDDLGNEDGILSFRWLSSVHECQFAGVVCNDKMEVVGINLSKSISVDVVACVLSRAAAFSSNDSYSSPCRWPTTDGSLPCWYYSSSLS